MFNNVSNAKRRAMLKEMRERVHPTREYEITDPHHRPDLRGEFAGAKVARREGKQLVHLTERGARFYLDQGVLQLTEAERKIDEERAKAEEEKAKARGQQ